MKLRVFAILVIATIGALNFTAQDVQLDKQKVMNMTSSWTGERTNDGWPKVSNDLLKRLEKISIEGFVKVRDTPGLGVTLNEKVVKEHLKKEVFTLHPLTNGTK